MGNDMVKGQNFSVTNTKLRQHDMRERFFTSQVLATAIGNGRLMYKVPNGRNYFNKRSKKFN